MFQVNQTKKFSRSNRQKALRWMNDLTRPLRNRKAQKLTESPHYLSDNDSSEDDRSVKKVTSFCGTGVLCGHCEREGCGWFCAGPCRRAFHTVCKDLKLDPSH